MRVFSRFVGNKMVLRVTTENACIYRLDAANSVVTVFAINRAIIRRLFSGILSSSRHQAGLFFNWHLTGPVIY